MLGEIRGGYVIWGNFVWWRVYNSLIVGGIMGFVGRGSSGGYFGMIGDLYVVY